jgi:hypothetical protein
VVYLDRIPTIHCVHASCAAEVQKATRALRAAILNPNEDAGFVPPALTPEDKVRLAKRNRDERLRVRAMKSLPTILKNYHWTYDEILNDSPVHVKGDPANHWHLLLRRLIPSDVVWIGNIRDSGSPECASNFKTVADWLSYERPPGNFICPNAFKNAVCTRSNDNVVALRCLVVESDVLNKNEVGAIFRWLMACGLNLVAVVDTGGKSLHGWFDYAHCEPVLDELRLLLPAMKCDPKLFTPSQPVRLPGVVRDGKMQRLVYLTKEEVC